MLVYPHTRQEEPTMRVTKVDTSQVRARYTFPDLCHAEALLSEHAKLYQAIYPWPGFEEYDALHTALAADLRSEEAKVAHILCQKCRGTGMTGWTHRHGGVCYQCGGYGCKKAYRQSAGE